MDENSITPAAAFVPARMRRRASLPAFMAGTAALIVLAYYAFDLCKEVAGVLVVALFTEVFRVFLHW